MRDILATVTSVSAFYKNILSWVLLLFKFCAGNNEQNVILWLDHRAFDEAEFINSLKHPVLKYVGGKISLEMETPKLLWLKKNLKEQCWKKAGYFFDLPDFLTWRATGADSRFVSLCI